MKTPHLLVTLGVAVMATLNVLATDALLSPRASEHYSKIVPGVNADPNLAAPGLASASPRVLEGQIKTVAGKSTAVSMSCDKHMAGSPKMIGACSEHPGAPMSCCSVADMK